MNETLKKYGSNLKDGLVSFITAGVGVGVGAYGMKLVPQFTKNVTVNKAAPGAIGILLAVGLLTFTSNRYAKNIAIGIGIAGVLDMLNKFLSGSTNETVQKIATYVPKLGAVVQNTGAYPPSYFLNIDRAGRSLNGLPARSLGDLPARSLQGATNKAYGLQGATNKAYGLQGATNVAFGLM